MRLLDVEGTVCPVAFVRDVLFPYARERLGAFLAEHPTVGQDGDQLRRWMDEDRKEPALKAIQGRIWREGYLDGTLRAPLYDDVVPALDRWRAAGERVAVFSSGSVEAQRLFFGHTLHGDLLDRFAGFFDTEMGSKRAAEAYGRIAAELGIPPRDVTFYSDVGAELDAAVAAGMRAVGVVRDGGPAIDGHRWVTALEGE